MTNHRQTRLGVQNSHRSPAKVRRLTAEQLGIPSIEEEEQDDESGWTPLQEIALEAADETGTGAAVRTDEGTISSGARLSRGASQEVHALELAVWKGYSESESPVVNVVVASKKSGFVPCGRCLQVLSDYSTEKEITIQITSGDEIEEYSLIDLLPN